jgi:hypothetical protein
MGVSNLKENSFEGGPGGSSGVLNYGTTYGTPSGGNVSQYPGHFASSDKTVNHMNNQETGSMEQKPLDPKDNLDPAVDDLFKKKNTPNPDEIMTGLQYELGQMVKKDKMIAKKLVIANLKKDPQFYSRLGMMNIDDKKMKVDEIQKIFQGIAEAKIKKFEPASDAILEAMRETIAWKENRKLKFTDDDNQ